MMSVMTINAHAAVHHVREYLCDGSVYADGSKGPMYKIELHDPETGDRKIVSYESTMGVETYIFSKALNAIRNSWVSLYTGKYAEHLFLSQSKLKTDPFYEIQIYWIRPSFSHDEGSSSSGLIGGIATYTRCKLL